MVCNLEGKLKIFWYIDQFCPFKPTFTKIGYVLLKNKNYERTTALWHCVQLPVIQLFTDVSFATKNNQFA